MRKYQRRKSLLAGYSVVALYRPIREESQWWQASGGILYRPSHHDTARSWKAEKEKSVLLGVVPGQHLSNITPLPNLPGTLNSFSQLSKVSSRGRRRKSSSIPLTKSHLCQCCFWVCESKESKSQCWHCVFTKMKIQCSCVRSNSEQIANPTAGAWSAHPSSFKHPADYVSVQIKNIDQNSTCYLHRVEGLVELSAQLQFRI